MRPTLRALVLALSLLPAGTARADITIKPDPASTSAAALKACLESTVTRTCEARSPIVLPAGANVWTVRTANSTANVNGKDIKALRCNMGAHFSGTDDTIADAATLKLDLTDFIHDWEFEIDGCQFNSTPTDVETPLAIEAAAGIGGRLRIRNTHIGQQYATSGVPLKITGAFSVSLDDSFLETLLTVPFATLIDGSGMTALSGAAGQGGWFSIQRTKLQAHNFGGCVDLSGLNTGHSWNLSITDSLTTCADGWKLGGAPNVQLAGGIIACLSTTCRAPFRFTATSNANSQASIMGHTMLNAGTSATFAGLWHAEGSTGRGPRFVDVAIGVSGNSSGQALRSLATASNATASVALEFFNIRLNTSAVAQPWPFGTPPDFDDQYMAKLAAAGVARGQVSYQGRTPITYYAGVPSSAPTMFAQTVLDLANAGAKVIGTPSAPVTLTKALCVSDDDTGSATLKLRKKTGAVDVTPSFACGYKKTDATAEDCTPGPCTGAQSSTLTSTPSPQTLRCVADATTFFEFDAGSSPIELGSNIDTNALPTLSGTAITWTPLAGVTTDLACTYHTLPAWVTLTGANTFAELEAIELVGVSGFGGAGKGRTRVYVEAAPQ